MATASELSTWTQVGAQDAARVTYAAVQTALKRSPSIQGFDVEVFLQGSYANHTNTRGDSDVDIVVMMKSAFMANTDRLDSYELENYKQARIPATTTVSDLRVAVNNALTSYFGGDRVHQKNKCLRVDRRNGYVDADVVPCQQYRAYTDYPDYGTPDWIEGISIQPIRGDRIVNFPKRHRKNGETKSALTVNNYKPKVRKIKRRRRAAVNAHLVERLDAPGYLLECLTYNAPNGLFVSDDVDRVIKVLGWLRQFSPEQLSARMQSCDEIHWLFRTDPGDHNEYTTHRVLQAIWELL